MSTHLPQAPTASSPNAMHSQVAPLTVGQKVEGEHQGRIRQGEVIEANDRHYSVRWSDGFRNTCMQGFDYGDSLRVKDAS